MNANAFCGCGLVSRFSVLMFLFGWLQFGGLLLGGQVPPAVEGLPLQAMCVGVEPAFLVKHDEDLFYSQSKHLFTSKILIYKQDIYLQSR